MNWIDLIWAVAPATIIYAVTRAEVARLRNEITGKAAHITRLEKENAHLDARARRSARRADVMTAAALTIPPAPSIAALTADRIRAEREEELNQHGAPL